MSLLLLVPTLAHALDTDTFEPVGSMFDQRAGVQVESSRIGDPGAAYGGLTVAYAHAPVVKLYDDGERELLVDTSFGTHLSGGYTFGELLRVDLSLPLYPYVGAEAGGYTGGSVGDARLAALVPVLRRERFDVAVRPSLLVPTGSPAKYTGAGGVGAGLVAAVEARPSARMFLAANAGVALQRAEALGDLALGSGLTVGAGAGFRATDRVTVGAELDGVVGIAGAVNTYSANPVEAHAYGTYATPMGVVATLGAGTGVVRGVGAPDARVLLAVGYAKPGKPKVVDLDGDGFLDTVDACVDTPETVNAWKDDDGCPDTLGVVAVAVYRDGKPVGGADVYVESGEQRHERFGLVGAADFEAVPGTEWRAHADMGRCLAGDGAITAGEARSELRVDVRPVLDASVALEIVDAKGKPVPSAMVTWERHPDGCAPTTPLIVDGGSGSQPVGVGKHRVFVTAPGYAPFVAAVELDPGERELVRAVLVPTKVVVEKTRIVILDKVYFETAKAVIKPESFGLLNQVADTLLSHPDIARVEVAGHTDSDGTDASNLTLSQARSESVVAYLVARGVDAGRLTGKGYGEAQPIDSNKTKAGKSNNRRVEFTILDTPADGATP